MTNEQKSLAISTIPIPKLTVLMNNFICNTVTHLNKLSVKGDEKLAEFDKKLNDLEIMTTLLEAKLNSLPEKITSTYPPIEPTSLIDVNHDISNSIPGSGSDVPVPPPEPPEPDQDNQNLEDIHSVHVRHTVIQKDQIVVVILTEFDTFHSAFGLV